MLLNFEEQRTHRVPLYLPGCRFHPIVLGSNTLMIYSPLIKSTKQPPRFPVKSTYSCSGSRQITFHPGLPQDGLYQF